MKLSSIINVLVKQGTRLSLVPKYLVQQGRRLAFLRQTPNAHRPPPTANVVENSDGAVLSLPNSKQTVDRRLIVSRRGLALLSVAPCLRGLLRRLLASVSLP